MSKTQNSELFDRSLDVGHAGAVFVESGDFDLESWYAAQQKPMPNLTDGKHSLTTNADMLVGEYASAAKEVQRLGAAREVFTGRQSAVNIQVESDNFIRDSIAGK